MRALGSVLLVLAIASGVHAQNAKPREFGGVVSGQPNGFNTFIRANEGKVVQLSLFFDKVPELGKERKGDVYPPTGYRGEELTPFFTVKEGSYWIRNAPGGRKWRKKPFYDWDKDWLQGRFRVRKNPRAGRNHWYYLDYVGPAGPPSIPKDADPDGPG
ncbi:hypothetical protein EON81_04555 [bacterium]|nr:MAG: hypothetical protein EON81_04555 [bacterium]